MSALIGVFATIALVLLDEAWLDLPSMLPFLPVFISNGWIPLAALLLALIGYGEALRMLGATACETRLAVFVLLVGSFVTLTLMGIFFRGEGMALVIPLGVLP
jgi:hypothetical protein